MTDELGLTIVRVLTITLTVAFFSVTVQPLVKVVRARSTDGASPVQFYGIFVGAITWLSYGIAIKEISMILANSVGVFMAAVGVSVFLYLTPFAADRQPIILRTLVSALVPATIMISLLVGLKHNVVLRDTIIGVLGCLATFVMFGSPLLEAWAIVKTSDARRLKPIVLTFAMLMPLSWLILGFILRDVFLIVPNVASVLVVGVQVAIRLWIGPPRTVEPATGLHTEYPSKLNHGAFEGLLVDNEADGAAEIPADVLGLRGQPSSSSKEELAGLENL